MAAPRLAFARLDDDAGLHLRLTVRNQARLRPDLDGAPQDPESELADRVAEERFVAAERERIRPLLAAVPADAGNFVGWFESLRDTGPGQGDALFPWLADSATLDEMRWFIGQEVAGEAGFEDLLALTQLRMPERAKLEMARNFWDEMGRGRPAAMHGPLLNRLADAVGAHLPPAEIVWPSLALANMMVALAWNRHYAYQAVGALGVIELTAPGRAEKINDGLRRLGVEPAARKYFALHAHLDRQHSAAWNAEVLQPLVAAEPRAARAIAEGALLRLSAGARCFETYRGCFWGSQPQAMSRASSPARKRSPMSQR